MDVLKGKVARELAALDERMDRVLERVLPSIGEPFFVSPEAERTIWDARFPARSVLIFGSETKGLPESLRERNKKRLFSIPMKGRTLRSLNLSTAVGVVLYEVLRQQRRSQALV